MTMPTSSVDARAGVASREDVSLVSCPLCGEPVAREELQAHVRADSEEIREYVLSVIRTSHPEWIGSDGSCAKCWESYRNL